MLDLVGPLLLLLLGLGLLMAEAVLPTGGMLGLLAVASLAGSAWLAFGASATLGWRWVILEGALVPGTWFAAFATLPRTRLGRRIFLQPPEGAEPTSAQADRPRLAHALGRSGRVLTPLRPSGMVEVDGRRVDALAESGLIAVGSAVTVVAVRSGCLIVREI